MFVRTIDVRTKPGMAQVLCATVAKGIPLLKRYSGFVDCLCLVSEEVPDMVLVMTVWDSKQAADTFQREGFPLAADLYRTVAQNEIVLLTFEVGFSTAYSVGAVQPV